MIKLEMKNYIMILTEEQQKYKPYQQVKLINMKSDGATYNCISSFRKSFRKKQSNEIIKKDFNIDRDRKKE